MEDKYNIKTVNQGDSYDTCINQWMVDGNSIMLPEAVAVQQASQKNQY